MAFTLFPDLRDMTALIYFFLAVSNLRVATALPEPPAHFDAGHDTGLWIPTPPGQTDDDASLQYSDDPYEEEIPADQQDDTAWPPPEPVEDDDPSAIEHNDDEAAAANQNGNELYNIDNDSTDSTDSFGSYQCFGGEIDAYPSPEQWIDLDALYALYEPTLKLSNSDDLNKHIYDAVVQVSEESGVDARLILALIMQESTGKVNAECTGGYNCGLLQAGVDSVSFDPSNPRESILQMIRDGINGSGGSGDGENVWPGLDQYLSDSSSLSWANIQNPGNVWEALRAYNSGNVSPSGNLDEASDGTTKAYVNDMANRLVGWDGSEDGCVQVQCGLRPESDCAGGAY